MVNGKVEFKKEKFLAWLKLLQLKGISHDNLNKLISNNSFKNNNLSLDIAKNNILNSNKIPLTKYKYKKYRLLDKYLYIYKIPNFLDEKYCEEVINLINNSNLVRTGKGSNFNSYTDKKCVIENNPFIKILNQKMSLLIGNTNSLPTLGMKYFENDFKENHFDNPWKFVQGKLNLGFNALKDNSITTWTFMIYLNDVKNGGETFFPNLNLKISPKKGTALIWNNLLIDGSINPYSQHQSLKVKNSQKYIITKWFKELLE